MPIKMAPSCWEASSVNQCTTMPPIAYLSINNIKQPPLASNCFWHVNVQPWWNNTVFPTSESEWNVWIIHFSGNFSAYYLIYGMTLKNLCSNCHYFSTLPAHNQKFILKTQPPDTVQRYMLTEMEKNPDISIFSPWIGLLHPGRNRWWRRSRPPTELPILYTRGQRQGQISSMETRWMVRKEYDWDQRKWQAGLMCSRQ